MKFGTILINQGYIELKNTKKNYQKVNGYIFVSNSQSAYHSLNVKNWM